ncbi:hypothetical protein [aff. Roholtiella sp. LEGE 12411]|nr:hypothetical protein [aff. Roholtiella sp. LEGE 12411]
MKGLILIDLPSTIEEDYFFRKGEIVEAGYHICLANQSKIYLEV